MILVTFKEHLIGRYGYNEPISVDMIQFKSYSRSWIFKELKKLVDKGEIKRFDVGLYYFPKKMFFGDSLLDPRKVVERRFITDGSDVYGYISGVSLLNQTGLSTQVPNLIELVTNKETTRVREINIGTQHVRARCARTFITKENVNTLQFLDLMNTVIPNDLGKNERYMLSKYIKASGVTRFDVMDNLKFFPNRAAKNLMDSGAAYELA